MKALEILKNYKKSVSPLSKRGSLKLCNEIDEAIAELEALQSNYEAQEIIRSELQKDIIKITRWGRTQRDYAHKNYQEALELKQQLEALQAPRTCDGCEYEKCQLDTPLHDLYCANCSRIHTDYYEPKKDTQC